jgi:hypothetical protein
MRASMGMTQTTAPSSLRAHARRLVVMLLCLSVLSLCLPLQTGLTQTTTTVTMLTTTTTKQRS